MEAEEVGEVKSLSDYIQILRRRKYLILLPMLCLLIISVVVALILPPVYRSEATVLIEQQHIPIDLVQSTVVSLADERIKQIEQKIMTINNINLIIDKYNLYKEQAQKISNTELAGEFRTNTQLELISANIIKRGRRSTATLAFKLAFSHKNPIITQKVTNELVTLYLDENIKNRTERALETTNFLEIEASKFKLEIQKIENKIAQYKEKYSDSLPELLSVNVASISRSENELQQLSLQEKMLNERRISLRTQLSMTSPSASSGAGNNQSEGLESAGQLEDQYQYLLNKYSEFHPDVKAIKRKIDNLNAVDPSASRQTRAATNPIYLQLKSEMEMAAIELSNIQKQKITLKHTLDKLEVRVSQTHQVERGYYDLMRDLENHSVKYKELKAKALEAKLSQTLEEEQKAEKFTLIEPARVPLKPEKPNRIKIVLMGLALSIAVGLGAGYTAEIFDQSIRGHHALEQVTGFEPLVVIPYINNQEDLDRDLRNKRTLIMVFIFFIVGLVLAVHFLYKPLDILWFKVLHKVSML